MAEKLTQEQKKETLEDAVMRKSAAEAGEICKSLGRIHFSARALGIACRFKGIDYVKALVENGADFANRYSKVHTDLYYWRTDFAATLFDINEVLSKSNSVHEKDDVFGDVFSANGENLKVLPRGERLKIAEYLLDNAEKCLLNTDNFLMNSILVNDREFIDLCREKGVKFSEEYAAMLTIGNKKLTIEWSDFSNRLFDLSSEDFYAVITNLRQECNGELILFTDIVRIMLKSHLDNVDFFRFVLDNFNRAKMNQKAIVEDIIEKEALPCLPIVEEIGWLRMPRKRDEYIKYASDEGKTECTAWLMDFKNRTADFAAEREKAEKKMQREINAAPDSVTEMKKIWSFKKQEDDTLIITNYKGKSTEITVPEKIGKNTVTALAEGALSQNGPRKTREVSDVLKNVTKITLPSTIKSIGEGAFEFDYNLQEVNIPDGVDEIKNITFLHCRTIKSISLPESVKKIGNAAFSQCYKLEQINLPQGLTEIDDSVFNGCKSLETIEIPDSVTKIERNAFQDCHKLREIVIPNGVEEIGIMAFGHCKNLQTIVIPPSVRTIKNATGIEGPITIFSNAPNVTAIVEPKSYAEKYCEKHNIPYKYAAI
ncbi:MAG: leucine-rich repeat domain-containing protein [Oscillospiraceae bacterium]|nr:leucine-rich repeat domain-containing protein [Oscillospiraceae bacterium]